MAPWLSGRGYEFVTMGQNDRTGTGRREALRLALGAALLPMLGARPALATPATDLPLFAPPSGAMTYRRTLVRELPGGAELRTTRDFAVQFAALGRGFQVTGQQVRAQVEAPASLAQLAALEEQRVELGIFPLLLDHSGRIIDGSNDLPSDQIARALEQVRRTLGTDGEEAGMLVEALHAAGSQLTAELPLDLFAPEQAARQERQFVPLPWGETGEVETRFEAVSDPQTHLMRSARREVITRLGGDERRSGEQWALFPA